MTGVEFVGSGPLVDSDIGTDQNHEPSSRTPWSKSELEVVLGTASGHIRYLLRELSEADSVAAGQMKSKPVAYAQVQRICNSRGKDALVTSTVAAGTKHYALNPQYRSAVALLVAGTEPPPPTEPKPPSERRPRGMRRLQGMSALDGIADSRGTSYSAPAPAPNRRIAQGQAGRSLAIPGDVSIEFCKELLGFVNATANGTRFRIVLEDDGYRLEAC